MNSIEAKVTFIEGRDSGKSLPVKSPGSFIGRESDNDIRLSCEGASRYHAKIEFSEDLSWLIRDLGSSNGTRLNGKKIAGFSKLSDGDVISFGGDIIKFEASQVSVDAKPDKKSAPAADRSAGGKDEKMETYLKARLSQEMALLAKKLKAEKIRRLRLATTVVLVAVNLTILSIYLMHVCKSRTLYLITSEIIRILEHFRAGMR